jgi:hypothetical protein
LAISGLLSKDLTARVFWLRWAVVAALCTGVLTNLAAAVVDDSAGVEFFEKKIRPILADDCYKCHSQDSEKVKGGLLLDTREGLLKGGDTGPAIVPGEPDKSLLIKAVRYADENLQMPPKGKKLAAEKIANLEAWVKMGAPDPRVTQGGAVSRAEAIREKARTHWAFQPVKEPAIPAVMNKRLVQTPVDNFVLAQLEAKGMRLSPPADRRTLIRRATFDLTGLPPTPEEVGAFEADKSPDAFAKVVDRLLASPHYGERWGRHWLDVARYADTKGYVFEEDRHYPYSYTYRDYVIRAFNEDLPYDEFIKEQIAADLMPLEEDKRPLAALGFLTLGRRFVNNIHDIIDDRIDVVCRGTMGLTVECARCHDHKYDPIPTRDYYSLYGVFASSTEPEVEPLLGDEVASKAHDEYDAERKKRVAERDNYRHEKEEEMAATLRYEAADYMMAVYEVEHSLDKPKVEDVAHKHKLDAGVVHRWKKSLESWSKPTNEIFAPWAAFAELPEKEFSARAKDLSAKFAANKDSAVKLNPPVARSFDGEPPATMKDVADRYGKVFTEIDQDWQKALAVTNAPTPKAFPDTAKEALRQVMYAEDAPANLPRGEFHRLYDIPTAQKMRALQRASDELDATHPGAPPRAMALVDKPDPNNVQVFIRGNSDNHGPEAPRQFLEVIAGPNRKPFVKGSGRLELAEAIARRDNPLTARVFVNRVWLQHFGAALVGTPSDFGLRSDPPTNPQLLDYLAARFMAEGWSIKQLHRLIMLSSTYQQSSENNVKYAKVDPGNQLLWRMNRQRLDFEAMRDTLLSVSGKLDLTLGGHAVDITSGSYSTRRTVYGYVDRQNLPSVFRAFDFASPDTTSPRRFYTTVPQQALFLMNSPFVIDQARNLVNRPDFKGAHSEREQIRLLYQLAFQRDPTHDETEMARQFVKSAAETPAPEGNTNWLFGYGTFDDASKRVKGFQKLPFYAGGVLQGGPSQPDPKLGWVMLTSTGGHPGNDQQHAAIRRWIAPREGFVSIKGTLTHPDPQGDGVRGRIVSSELGVLGQWVVHNSKSETAVDHVAVKQGDTIDFVTDCYGTVYFDSFGWAPTVRLMADGKTQPGQRMEWSAANDFDNAARVSHPNLGAWQKYAQVLLLTDELVFVD